MRQELGLSGEATYLVDPNEGCLGPWVVLEFLDALERISPEAYAALAYIEQPTERAHEQVLDPEGAGVRGGHRVALSVWGFEAGRICLHYQLLTAALRFLERE